MALFDQTPQVPTAPNVNLQADQIASITGNQKALPGIDSLAASTNTFNADQLHQLLSKTIPGYDAINAKASANIQSELAGNLPSDVQNQIEQGANAQATAGGYGGAGMGRALTARDLGLTSLNLTNQGLSSAESWMTNVTSKAMPQLFDPASMFVSPAQQAANDWANQTSKFQRDWVSNVTNANANNAKLDAIGGLIDPAGTAIQNVCGSGNQAPAGTTPAGSPQFQTPPVAPLDSGYLQGNQIQQSPAWAGADASTGLPASGAADAMSSGSSAFDAMNVAGLV